MKVKAGQVWETKDKREPGRRVQTTGTTRPWRETSAADRCWICEPVSASNRRHGTRQTTIAERTLLARWRLVEEV